jgi:hypothetical protein
LEFVFDAAFGLIDNERFDGFIFLITQLRHLAKQHIIRLSDVIITDYDQRLKNALQILFPDLQQ